MRVPPAGSPHAPPATPAAAQRPPAGPALQSSAPVAPDSVSRGGTVSPPAPAGAPAVYAAQDRGDAASYLAYWAGMDKSMQQKIGLMTAYTPSRGIIADMGSGSGSGTHDLANLFDNVKVIGFDVNPVAVKASQERFKRSNLEYATGDVAKMLMPAGSLAAIFNCSTSHHVTSFNGFALEPLFASFDNQVAQLETGGFFVHRDFVVPQGPATVWIDLPATNGLAPGDPALRGADPPDLSTAALFERFARDFRSSQNRDGPVPIEKLGSPRPGWERYEVSLRAAAEFVLRKDYRDHWEVELQEEYTYLSQPRFEEELKARKLRVVVSMEIHNPWIVTNRFEGKFELRDTSGAPLAFPPTNYFIVGEKIGPGQGAELRQVSSQGLEAARFLSLSTFEHRETGTRMELVQRPGHTLDVVPWFADGERVYIVARHGFPRPVVATQQNLDRSTLAGYITEPIAALVPEAAPLTESVRTVLEQRAEIPAEHVGAISEPLRYYTSPGGLNERVTAQLVEVAPRFDKRDLPDPGGELAGGGSVTPFEATQVLRAYQVGGMFDSRLEINTYMLLLGLQRPLGPWVGAEVQLRSQRVDVSRAGSLEAALHPPARAVFTPVADAGPPKFFEVRRARFEELGVDGDVLHTTEREYVVPKTLGASTATLLPVVRGEDGIYVGLELRDLPAAQHFEGSATLATVPAWRAPKAVKDLPELERWTKERLRADFGAEVHRMTPLGGKYYPSAGATPELVYPYVVEVGAEAMQDSRLTWVRLDELVARRAEVRDAHLLTSSLRLAHALGALR